MEHSRVGVLHNTAQEVREYHPNNFVSADGILYTVVDDDGEKLTVEKHTGGTDMFKFGEFGTGRLRMFKFGFSSEVSRESMDTKKFYSLDLDPCLSVNFSDKLSYSMPILHMMA